MLKEVFMLLVYPAYLRQLHPGVGIKTTVYVVLSNRRKPIWGKHRTHYHRALNIWSEYSFPLFFSTQMLPPQGDKGTVPFDNK